MIYSLEYHISGPDASNEAYKPPPRPAGIAVISYRKEIEQDGAAFVCIEPWVSLPSEQGKAAAFEEQPDLIALEPGGQYQNHWSITVST